jgi:hypothetical protein
MVGSSPPQVWLPLMFLLNARRAKLTSILNHKRPNEGEVSVINPVSYIFTYVFLLFFAVPFDVTARILKSPGILFFMFRA